MPAPPRRSTSTAWCGITTCASRRNWATCRSTCADKEERDAQQPRHRARPAPAAGALKLPEGTTLKVVEVPPGPPVLATLLAEIYGPDADDPARDGGRGEEHFPQRCRSSSMSTTVLRPSAAAAADQHRPGPSWNIFGVEQSDVYDTMQALFGGVPVGYSHRGEERDPIEHPHRPAEARPELGRAPGLDAGAGQHAARQQRRVVELGEVVQRDNGARLAACCSAATGISPTW